jgi:hypothetical protein
MHTKHNRKGASTIQRKLSLAGCFLMICLLAGCDSPLQKVAKDWCEVIRASQVIPVYPLTEDLQPGDVFLVTQPVQDQAAQYKKRGFLPFDYHVARLNITSFPDRNYTTFYKGDYWEGDYTNIPHPRPRHTADSNVPVQTYEVPRAAFPSYTFKVENNQGLQLALPVQGIPVGMNLLNATAATGTINITDAYTYGIDAYTLANVLRDKAESDLDLKAELKALIAAHPKARLYLRVIYRVYLTGGVDISLRRTSSYGVLGEIGAVFVGRNSADRPLDPNNLKSYAETLKNLSEGMKLPWGGAIKLTGSSNSSVTLKENFDRLLVIGYLGVDMPVTFEGTLGTPVTTSQLLYHPSQEPPVVAGGPLTDVQSDVKMRLRNIKYLFDSSEQRNKDALFAKQLAEADKQLKKPKSLDRFREGLANAAFNELFAAFYTGCMSYASRTDENSKAHYKIIIVLDKAITNLE